MNGAGEPMSWSWLALILTACVAGSAFFSGSETGLMSASRIRLRGRAQRRRDPRLRTLERLLLRLEDSILTCLIGNNLVNVLASAVATAALAARFGPDGRWLAALLVTVLLVVFGEILPKVFFREYPESMMTAASPPLRAVMLVVAPVRWAMRSYAGLLQRMLPGAAESGRSSLGREAVRALLLAHPQPQGEDQRFAGELDRFLALAHVPLHRIMLPLERAVTVARDDAVAACAEAAARSGHSRLPVRAGDGRALAGWLLARDLLLLPPQTPPEAPLPRELVRTCLLADQRLTPYELLAEMQWQRQQMAIVVDRGGAPLGLVTLENLVEAVVGGIEDEFDRPAAAAAL